MGVFGFLSVLAVCITGLAAMGTICWWLDEWKRLDADIAGTFNARQAGGPPPPQEECDCEVCKPRKPANPNWNPDWGDDPRLDYSEDNEEGDDDDGLLRQ